MLCILAPLVSAQDVVIRESLAVGSSATTVHGGTFTGDGWRVDDSNSRMFWDFGTQVDRGTISVVIDDVTFENLTGDNNHFIELFDEGGHWDCNRYIVMRVYGIDTDHGDLKLKAFDGTNLAEARGGVQDWDGNPHTWTITWDATSTVIYRDGVEVVYLDTTGFDLRVGTLWLPLNEWNNGYSAPLGTVFRDLDFVAWEPGEEADPEPTDDGDPTTFTPLDDVGAVSYESDVFGDDDDLPADGSDELSYLKFDLGDATGLVTSATLRLNVRDDGSAGGSGASVWSVTDDRWDEETLTWGTRPTPIAEVASLPALGPGESIDLDVTAAVATGEAVSFAILGGSDGLHFASKEDGDGADAAVLTVLTAEEGDTEDTEAEVGDSGYFDDWEAPTARDEGDAGEAEGGCACDGAATRAGWMAVLAALAVRRRS